MKVLVAYASRRGSTAGIAERIAETLGRHGLDVTFREIAHVGAPEGFDAFVIGSSAYMGHWEKGAAEFVRDHAATLALRPTWLFSAGPIGTDLVDKQGRDVIEASRPLEFAEFKSLVRPRDERVFFGAYDPEGMKASFAERMVMKMPGVREAMPAGDFRDWPAIEAWADGIAEALGAAGVPA
jgi:menaquinone-dependent protoporphyrinogen oxidase